MPNLESRDITLDQINLKQQIVNNYRKVADSISNMFTEMRPRIVYELWRTDGIGSCSISAVSSELEIEGPARDRLLELRHAQNPNAYDEINHCGYHRENYGCTIGDLKSPMCLKHIDAPWELQRRFGIDGYQLIRDIKWILQSTLLNGSHSEDEDSPTETQIDDNFVEDAIYAVGEMKKHIKKYPKAQEEDIEEFKKRFSR